MTKKKNNTLYFPNYFIFTSYGDLKNVKRKKKAFFEDLSVISFCACAKIQIYPFPKLMGSTGTHFFPFCYLIWVMPNQTLPPYSFYKMLFSRYRLLDTENRLLGLGEKVKELRNTVW